MKKKLDIKKLVLLNLPYVFAFYFVDKLAAVFRLAPGTEFIDKPAALPISAQRSPIRSPAFIQ